MTANELLAARDRGPRYRSVNYAAIKVIIIRASLSPSLSRLSGERLGGGGGYVVNVFPPPLSSPVARAGQQSRASVRSL